jgi:hypothetical protein
VREHYLSSLYIFVVSAVDHSKSTGKIHFQVHEFTHFMDYSSEQNDYLQPWNMDVCSSIPAMWEGSQGHNFKHPLESMATAFYGAETYTALQEHGHEVHNSSLLCSQLPSTCNPQIIFYQSSGDKFSLDNSHSHTTDTLQSHVKSPLCGNQYCSSILPGIKHVFFFCFCFCSA